MSDKHYYMYKLHTCTYKLQSFFKKCKNYLSAGKYPLLPDDLTGKKTILQSLINFYKALKFLQSTQKFLQRLFLVLNGN